MSTALRFKAKNGLDNGSNTIINVVDPVNAQDASTKNFSSNASNLTSGTVSNALLPAVMSGLTSVSATTFTGALTGNASSATTATNITGGAANGIPYQTGSGATSFLAQGTGVLQETAGAPSWTTTPTITGTNFSGIPNGALTNSSVTIGSTSVALGATSTTLGGMTGITFTSGTVTGVANPVNSTDVVNLSYLQSIVAGLEWKDAVAAATTANLVSTYSNGASGVGATLTNSNTQVAFAVDGYTANLNDRILVMNQTQLVRNGIYVVTNVGSGSTNWVLTRATDSNTTADLDNATVFVTNGTVNIGTGWTQTTAAPTIGTSNIVFVQFSGSGTYVAGGGLTLSGNTFSITSPIAATLGGTGTTSAPSTGQILVGTSSGTYAPYSLASGTGISTTTGSGTLQINNTGVTSIVAGTNISISGGTGAVTVNVSGTVSAATTATNLAAGSANQIPYQTGAGATSFFSAANYGVQIYGSSGVPSALAGAAGVLQGSASANPAFTTTPTLTGTNFTGIPNGALTNSSVTIGSTSVSLGSTVATFAGLTSVTSTTFVGALTGNASTATALAGGAANGIPYQTGSGATSFLAQGTGVLQETAGAPSWTTTPTITGTNFSSIPNGALSNSSVTIGSTNVALGATVTTFAGITSVTSATVAMTNAAETTATLTTSTTSAGQVIDTVSSSFRTIKYLISVTSGSAYQAAEILIINDGTTAWITEFADINTGSVLATFDASVSGGNLSLITTPTNAVTVYKVMRTAINA